MKKVVPLLVVVLGLSTWVYFAKIRPARIVDAVVRGSGSIEATEVLVSSKVAARIATITVAEGDAVELGQVLATLDCGELEVRRAQAGSQLTQAEVGRLQAQLGERQVRAQTSPLRVQHRLAETERDRARRLFESAVVTQRTVDQAEAAFDGVVEQLRAADLAVGVAKGTIAVAEAQIALAQKTVQLAQTQLDECNLTAPIAGVVMSKNREPGELVLPGASLMKLGRLDQVYTWIFVPNREVGRVALGQKVELVADTYPDRVFVGTVARINEKAEFTPKSIQTKEDRTRLVFGVKVTLDNADRALMPGMPVEARIVDDRIVPES
ncbi:MAG: hypothetical protein A2289_24175 [Deltaproteobacteria bacterium RIFOXYA12_FULL_58_15]|nr:MAG: hypothetical protein A2289_24175 [Deltaproteobacteria bacterium RIFOXYA12_FULL_58_15]OGR10124.1 MAG: hypothetical protein A2341_05945 [Deltaproteobacteria bacterium RIFOXYB12_FULL_58_9]